MSLSANVGGVEGLHCPLNSRYVRVYRLQLYAGLTSNQLLIGDYDSLCHGFESHTAKALLAQWVEQKIVKRSISVNSTGVTFNTRLKKGEDPNERLR